MNAKADRVLVTRKETLEDGNVAIYVDNSGKTFDTTTGSFTASGTEYAAPTYLSTMPWWTGSTDKVLGPTGSPDALTSGKVRHALSLCRNRLGQSICYSV